MLGGHGDSRGWDVPRSIERNCLNRWRHPNCPDPMPTPKVPLKVWKKRSAGCGKSGNFHIVSYRLSYKGRQYTFTRVSLLRWGGRRKANAKKQESCFFFHESCSWIRCRDKLFRKQRKALFCLSPYNIFILLSRMFYSVSDVKRQKKLCERVRKKGNTFLQPA